MRATGNTTLKVFDLDAPPAAAMKATIATGGTTRLDEMALTSNGRLLLAANNAEDPPFATLFNANGNDAHNHVSKITKITVDPSIVPATFGLSLEQPTWDPRTKRYYTSMPIIANNPSGCNYGAAFRTYHLRRRRPRDRSDNLDGAKRGPRRIQRNDQHGRRRAPRLRTERLHAWTGRQHSVRLYTG